MGFFRKIFATLSSFGFAVILLLLLLLLTWLGTLEQVDSSLYDVQKKYFDSILLVHEFGPFDLRLPVFEHGEFGWSHHPFGPIPIPLPGAYLVMALLLANLLVGGILRLRKSWRTAGILVAHLGIVMMLVAGFVKFRYSYEGNLPIATPDLAGKARGFPREAVKDTFQSYHEWEVAIFEAVEEGTVTEHLLPEEAWRGAVRDGPVTFTSDVLPFDLTVVQSFRNCDVFPKGPRFEGDSPVIDGYVVVAHPPAKEAEQNLAGLHVTFRDKATGATTPALLYGGSITSLGTRLPFTLEAGGKAWLVDLRKKRFKLPFKIRLDKFTFETHPGTGMARLYLSDVTKIEGDREQPLKITMNEPLRHAGYTLYQSSFGPSGVRPGEPAYSVFSVVKNPSDQWPKWSCYVIAVGLLWHFGAKLLRFIKSQQPRAAQPIVAPAEPAAAAASPTANAPRSRPAQAVRTPA